MSTQRETRDVHPIVRQIIDRDCHVSMSNREVIRHVISRLRNGYRTFREMPKAERRELLEQCRHQHRENFRLYVQVMSGQIGARDLEDDQ